MRRHSRECASHGSADDDGEQPACDCERDGRYDEPDMRDAFAIAALVGVVQGYRGEAADEQATRAYKIADAMLRRRRQ